MKGYDLTGEWWGTFSYPDSLGTTTPFIAQISELNGSFDGLVIEPDMVGSPETLRAAIVGVRRGSSFDFTKTYYPSAPPDYRNPVDYVGSLSADGNFAVGIWSLLEFDGSFEMHRQFESQTDQSQVTEPAVRQHLTPV